ncbi:MAG: hypothetical protein LBP26_00695 [Clostridiales bacterium]|jgi:hypothetical protein|nr:hypothetical protein [Clostridiales bacterium]
MRSKVKNPRADESANGGQKNSRGGESANGGQIRFTEELIASVTADYNARAQARRNFEAQWQLNSNFVLGNQFCSVAPSGEIEDGERGYYWQEREVFNHLAPILETRLAKLNRVRPRMNVRPASSDDDDIKTGKLAAKILNSACARLGFDDKVGAATYWSELCGTVFYKITWDANAGRASGKGNGRGVFEGDARIDVCPPYEVFPDSLAAQGVEECQSIIHARAASVDEIELVYGVRPAVSGGGVEVVSTGGSGGLSREKRPDHVLLIERYSRPDPLRPDGELVITAGDKLLHLGPLPYVNGEDGRRDLPFVKQESLKNAGCFYGISVLERAIPIQRAFNAVKNRKHEFLNRIAMGVLAVEDGSVDADNLAEEGLCPGKVLVYRQGSPPPRLLDAGRVPSDFGNEEDRLLSEFISVSGVSEIMRSSGVPASLTSGVALQILIEQDDTRLSVTAEIIRSAVRKAAKMILRLYKQFAASPRLSRCAGEEGELEILCWKSSDITCDDVVFDTENELNSTPAAKQNMMFELLKMGLLHDENGKLSDAMRYKILDVLGYGGWGFTRDLAALHTARAEKENRYAAGEVPAALEIDDHPLHIESHTKFLLSGEAQKLKADRPAVFERVVEHVREHKRLAAAEAAAATAAGGGIS